MKEIRNINKCSRCWKRLDDVFQPDTHVRRTRKKRSSAVKMDPYTMPWVSPFTNTLEPECLSGIRGE